MKTVRLVMMSVLLLSSEALMEAAEVGEWNIAAMDMIKSEGISNHFGNQTMATLHVAMFDAVNGIQQKYDPFLVQLRGPRQLSAETAAAAAAYEVLSTLYPDQKDTFKPLYEEQLARVSSKPIKNIAIVYGQLVARRVLNRRENDGSAEAGSVPYPDGTEPGQWRRTSAAPPVLPGWGQVRPFAMAAGDQFRLIGPPELTGYEYARDYIEVMEMGRNTSPFRTMDQTVIARFWAMGIPRMWNLAAHQLAEAMDCTLAEEARLFALLNVALADAQIVGWDMKYYYGFWRPVTAIRLGDQDNNDATPEDSTWDSLLPAPAFPEYPSGHSTSCGAAATVLAKFFGSDAYTFVMTSEANPALAPRTFDSFWEAAREAGMSRIYGGIHFNFSNTEGLEAGRSMGRYLYENYMTELSYTKAHEWNKFHAIK